MPHALRTALRPIGIAALVLAAGFAAGSVVGWLAGRVWVVGMYGIAGGLTIGAAATFADVLVLGQRSKVGTVASVMAVVLGWFVWQGFEDAHQRRAFAVDLAKSRAADTGLPPDELARAFDTDPDASVDFLARDADVMLDEAMLAATGFDGAVGRFIGRHNGGLRLAGAGSRQFGLPVPTGVAIGGTFADLLIGLWVLYRVRRGVRTPR